MMRQAFQSGIQFLTILISELTALALANGGHPPSGAGELYLPVLIAMGGALAMWAGAKVNVGGIENERLAVKMLNTDRESGELHPGTTPAMLAKPLPEALKP